MTKEQLDKFKSDYLIYMQNNFNRLSKNTEKHPENKLKNDSIIEGMRLSGGFVINYLHNME